MKSDREKFLENQLEHLLRDENESSYWKGERKGYVSGFITGLFIGVILTVLSVIFMIGPGVIF